MGAEVGGGCGRKRAGSHKCLCVHHWLSSTSLSLPSNFANQIMMSAAAERPVIRGLSGRGDWVIRLCMRRTEVSGGATRLPRYIFHALCIFGCFKSPESRGKANFEGKQLVLQLCGFCAELSVYWLKPSALLAPPTTTGRKKAGRLVCARAANASSPLMAHNC